MPKEMTAGELAERSLITKYRKTIWNRFIGGCKDYELIQPGDRIAVCISGGKDSMMLAKCMQHLQKYSDFPFEAEYLVMDPGYSPPNRELIERNARTLELPTVLAPRVSIWKSCCNRWSCRSAFSKARSLVWWTRWRAVRPATCAPGCGVGTCIRRRRRWAAIK